MPSEGSRREAEGYERGGGGAEKKVWREKGMEGCPGHAVRNDGRQFRLLDVNMKYTCTMNKRINQSG